MSENLRIYCELAKNLYPDSISNSGIDIETIAKVEKQLGFRLPSVLREFYLLFGRHKSINYSHNELISINCLSVEDNRLIFYQENQGVCYWGIDLKDIVENNPPVWVGQSIVDQEELDWHLASESLSDFLLVMLCWQSVMGGLPYVSCADNIEGSVIRKVKDNFLPVEIAKEYSGLKIFIGKGKVVYLTNGIGETSIYVGAVSKNGFLEIEELLQINWDYNSLDD